MALRVSPFLYFFQHTAIQKKIQIFANLFRIQITFIHDVRFSCTSFTHGKYKFNYLKPASVTPPCYVKRQYDLNDYEWLLINILSIQSTLQTSKHLDITITKYTAVTLMSIPSFSNKYFEELSGNLQPQVLVNVIENARAALKDERRTDKMMNGGNNVPVVELERIPEKLILVGDIHGDLQSLLWTLKEINFERLLGNPHNKLIFLGDYVDRGSNSIGVLYVVCFLKQKFPDSVVLMRGNHEAPMEFPFSSHDLPLELGQRYGRELGKSIYVNNILPLFQSLSLIILIPKQLLIVHGGLPTAEVFIPKPSKDLSGSAARNLLISSMEEILWNDPIEYITKGLDWEYSRRGYGKHFGMTVTRKWLKATGSKLVIRGHEPCQGFKVNHKGTILTLFSCNESYPGFQAAYLKITREELQNVNHVGQLVPYINRIPKLPELL